MANDDVDDELIVLLSPEELEQRRRAKASRRTALLATAVAVVFAIAAAVFTVISGRNIWVRLGGYVCSAIIVPCFVTIRFSVTARRLGLDSLGRQRVVLLLLLNVSAILVGFYHGQYVIRRIL